MSEIKEAKEYIPMTSSTVVQSAEYYKPDNVIFAQGTILTFPTKDEEFHMVKASETESYTLDSQLNIPVINTSGKSTKFQGMGFVGDNGRVLRNWFRTRNTSPVKVLLWDIGKPIGYEMTIFTPLVEESDKDVVQSAESINTLEVSDKDAAELAKGINTLEVK